MAPLLPHPLPRSLSPFPGKRAGVLDFCVSRARAFDSRANRSILLTATATPHFFPALSSSRPTTALSGVFGTTTFCVQTTATRHPPSVSLAAHPLFTHNLSHFADTRPALFVAPSLLSTSRQQDCLATPGSYLVRRKQQPHTHRPALKPSLSPSPKSTSLATSNLV